MAEKWDTRKFFRVFSNAPVILRVSRSHRNQVRLAQKNIAGKFLDLSEGGCGVEASFFVPKGTRLNVFVDRGFLTSKSAVKPAKGRTRFVGLVMSCVGRGLRKYRLGIQFEKVNSGDRRLIKELVKFVERRRHPRIDFGQD